MMFKTDKMIAQKFSFSDPIISYIFDTVDGKGMKKLQKCCKYILFKKRVIILDSLESSEFHVSQEIHGYNLSFPPNPESLNFFETCNIWLLQHLFLYGIPNPSKIISKIQRSDVSSLELEGTISMKEMQLLLKSGNVTYFSLANPIYHCDGSVVRPEELLALMPKALAFKYVLRF